MTEYTIFDIRRGLFSEDLKIEAKSPMAAMKKAYPNAKITRCTGYHTNYGNVVVKRFRPYQSYVYLVEEIG